MNNLRERISKAPSSPGVYLFKNQKNKAIYIGKASNLKNRLLSYLNKDDPRGRILLANAEDLDFIVTHSDVEALTLEESLIKLHKPRYNIRLKDDKKFPYLKITIQEEFPRVFFTRNLKKDGSLIFGPYTSAWALRQTRDALCRIFKLVSCNKDFSKRLTRPCLEYSLGKCSAPCTNQIDKDNYKNLVDKSIKFLKGESDELTSIIEKQMWEYAKKEHFEAAKVLRDQLFAIRRISQRQQIVSSDNIARDVIGISRAGYNCVACLFRIREDRLISKEIYRLKINPQDTKEEIVSAFIRLIYTHISFMPEKIIVPAEPFQLDIQLKWFREKGFDVKIGLPIKKEEKQLLKWTEKNAETELSTFVAKKRAPSAILELQEILSLKKPPRWIEAFDVSNLKQKYAVGSSVVFKDGRPYKQLYRRYRIKRVLGQNDFAMIKEIVSRRVDDIKEKRDMPDILLIDGGKAQQNAALMAIKEIDLGIPVFAIAKRSDQLYYPDARIISIPSLSRSVILLKRIRDEAHRFAIGYHRKLRAKTITESVLDKIPNIGKQRKIGLLTHFGSIEAIKKASEEEIAKVPGIGEKIARIIYETLHQ